MGQRSQIYIKMQNIGKAYFDSVKINEPNSDQWRDNVAGYVEEREIYEDWEKTFGNEETIIVAFYHQWMYGRSFVLIASMLLNMNKALGKEYKNPYVSKNWGDDSRDLPRTCKLNNPLDGIRFLQGYISNLFDFELSKYSRYGIEGFSLLNNENDERKKIYTRFDEVDNNDGVLIFDFITNKYCFVNIQGDSTVRKLPELCPVDAHTYLKAYYPETEEDCSEDDLKYAREKNKPIEFADNTRINKKFMKRFKGFTTLTTEELIDMFPKMKSELLKENKKIHQKTELIK